MNPGWADAQIIEDTAMQNTVKWKALLRRISEGTCTAFLGSETASGAVPPAYALAEEMAREYEYPLVDQQPLDLARVAQYVATVHDPAEAKAFIVRQLKSATANAPDFSRESNPHGLLARLPLPVYVTTTYVDLISQALRQVTPIHREPRIDCCRWNERDDASF